MLRLYESTNKGQRTWDADAKDVTNAGKEDGVHLGPALLLLLLLVLILVVPAFPRERRR